MARFVGIDVGAETVKVAELVQSNGRVEHGRRFLTEHHEEPSTAVLEAIGRFDWNEVDGAAVTGRLGGLVNLEKIPTKAAQLAGLDNLLPEIGPVTLITIGSRGFSVLERRDGGVTVFRENSRCSQGTGNFLRQLVARFGTSVEEASEACADVSDPATLSGRCPVILKTDMTHLANKGEDRTRILAGLYDAVCENVQVLLKPSLAPPKVVLAGGVAQSRRIRERFAATLPAQGMELCPTDGDDFVFIEAVGAAAEAARRELRAPPRAELLAATTELTFEQVPALRAALDRVRRLTRPPVTLGETSRHLVLGFDIGSTGSKAVAVDVTDNAVAWESYTSTNGDPVGAAQSLMQRFVDDAGGRHPIDAVGATGSGREIVGSLLATCYGPERVFIMNEIAAHAAGALHYDPDVDTIFEIGGQDAKYIRLAEGQVFDAAMNEACSAGTGSFIEEQGQKFAAVEDVVQMGELALEADCGISLGQHCSVFMAEVIDAAVGAGTGQPAILAGIYDSIIQNYLNRVKGNRSVGRRIFCQGMPFAADALAAAVAHQTERDVVVPPNPGTIGALGIALLTTKELHLAREAPALEIERFLAAAVIEKDTLTCPSTKGCGEPGNRCNIDRLTTRVEAKRKKFLWGGHCSLYDEGGARPKLPDMAPAPFRERRALLQQTIDETSERRAGRATVGISDEFLLERLYPFFATFLGDLGLDLIVHTDAGQGVLKRGIGSANVPYCAPVQLFNGVVADLTAAGCDYLFVPMLRDLPRPGNVPISSSCPVSQATPDLIRTAVGKNGGPELLSPRIDMGAGNLDSDLFADSCGRLAASVGVGADGWRGAYGRALAVQREFDADCLAIGRRALAFCGEHDVDAVVVLGRPYTIHNRLLNANIPNILRDLGAIGIPVDCYPIDDDVPAFNSMYWGHSQTNIRAAHQIRRSRGVYSVFCSTYSCGPDSFDLHFFAYVMEGKPFAIIETDGHAGDAGTKTRIEAFLYCVEGDRRGDYASGRRAVTDFAAIEAPNPNLADVRGTGRIVLLPSMGPGAVIAAAGLRAVGLVAEALPPSNKEALRIGRKYTSGKECVPATITLGSVLQRINQGDPSERYAFFMPAASGPCRQGVYNVFDKIVFEKLDLGGRLVLVTQPEADFFQGFDKGTALRLWAGIVAGDILLEMLHDVRPAESSKGAAHAIYERYFQQICDLLEASSAPSLLVGLTEIPRDMYGLRSLLQRAGRELAAVRDDSRELPTVLVVGETYVRIDPFMNDFVIDRLEQRGIRTKMVPFAELMEYSDWQNVRKVNEGRFEVGSQWLSEYLTKEIKLAVINRLYGVGMKTLGWPPRCGVADSVAAAAPYLNPDLYGEAVPTVGGPVHEYLAGEITGAINVGPLECMPTKVAEAQFFHVAERLGLTTLTTTLNGDPLAPEVLDNFAYEVHSRFAERHGGGARAVGDPREAGGRAVARVADLAAISEP